jgi:hypothetical protein
MLRCTNTFKIDRPQILLSFTLLLAATFPAAQAQETRPIGRILRRLARDPATGGSQLNYLLRHHSLLGTAARERRDRSRPLEIALTPAHDRLSKLTHILPAME